MLPSLTTRPFKASGVEGQSVLPKCCLTANARHRDPLPLDPPTQPHNHQHQTYLPLPCPETGYRKAPGHWPWRSGSEIMVPR